MRQPYDADKDVAIYDGQGDFFVVPAGMFTIFMPQDAHMPCLSPGEATTVARSSSRSPSLSPYLAGGLARRFFPRQFDGSR